MTTKKRAPTNKPLRPGAALNIWLPPEINDPLRARLAELQDTYPGFQLTTLVQSMLKEYIAKWPALPDGEGS